MTTLTRFHSFPATALAVALALGTISGCKKSEPATSRAAAGPGDQPGTKGAADPVTPVTFDLYIMSQCPFAIPVARAMLPIVKKLGPALLFKLDYIAQFRDGKLTSMHGQSEVDGDIIQLCAARHAPDKYLDLIVCMGETMRSIPGNWEACANELELDNQTISTCWKGSEGPDLMRESIARADQAQAKGSPTVFINGIRYKGGRSEAALLRAICNAYGASPRPATCRSLPAPTPVKVTALGDKRCENCASKLDRFLGRLKLEIPALVVARLDWSSPEGRAAFSENKLTRLPAVVFEPGADKVEEARRFVRRARKVGARRVLELGGFDPTREICDNGKDDTGNGLADCADPTCKDTMTCRTEQPGKLEIFTMSQCPYCLRAFEALSQLMDEAPQGSIALHINFVANEPRPGEFTSLHGPDEVAEDIRQLCAIEHYRQDHAYLKYIVCRGKEIRSKDWERCTGDATGIQAQTIRTCVDSGQGARLLSDNLKRAKRLGIGASPTWIANNKHKFNGISLDRIKKSFCTYNAGNPACQ